MRRSSYQLARLALALLAGLGTIRCNAQTAFHFAPSDDAKVPIALVRSVRVIPGLEGAAIEILATRPLTPVIATINNPLRLVVDLPKSLVASRMRISYRDPQVLGVRVNQFHLDPPTVRLVIDLDKQANASWDAAGNRLMVRLHPAGPTPIAPASSTFSQGTAAASSGSAAVAGAMMLAGSRTVAGSSVTAGADTATLHMARGGKYEFAQEQPCRLRHRKMAAT